MLQTLSVPTVVRRYFDLRPGFPVTAYELRWDDDGDLQRLWELPEGVNVAGPGPEKFGVKVERIANDAYAVFLLWDRTCYSWDRLTRVELLSSCLFPLMKWVGEDLRVLLDQRLPVGREMWSKAA